MNTSTGLMTDKEIKTVRHDYVSKIFPSASVSLVLILIILIYCALNENSGQNSFNFILFAFLPGMVVFFLLTRNHRSDLKWRKVSIEKAVIRDKNYKTAYEVGSASLPVNLLSIIFIHKLSQREMKEQHIYSLVVGEETFNTDKTIFEKAEIGGTILIRRAEHTQIFLGLEAS